MTGRILPGGWCRAAVRAGHRIRVQISGGSFPRYVRNFGTADPFAAATRGLPCRFGVHFDARHPSHVALPVMPQP
ncbi:MAG TPA: hypothetical protein VE733_30705 [Streptosporangiaceae bacterium]|nr:hypothetical protein [Streptosporangiaceae bacterium]